ncbi:MAG: hypothetical protein BRD57_03875 [Proteobacteria bacterium SW_6_67_9]|jgi:Flp pilus assembly protein TadD|nr:MAG: hypothetical protein BRD57_03875 [Proteobacteria bacterium SW_6_67_9]
MRPWLPIVVVLALAAGCATPKQESTEAQQPADEPLDTEATIDHDVDNRAVSLLWEQAQEARRAGRLDEAVDKLERAVRMAPEDAVIWSRLAELRLQQKDFAVAENLASKSNALAGDQRLLRYRNWLIVAEARRRRGDEEGARQAQGEAARVKSGS